MSIFHHFCLHMQTSYTGQDVRHLSQ